MKAISSRSNTLFRALLKLRNSSRERRARERTLLDGVHLIASYVEHFGAPLAVMLAPDAPENSEVRALLSRIPVIEPVLLADGLYRELSSVLTPTGIIAEIAIPHIPMAEPEAPCSLLVEDVQDPGNVGSILRSASAAGVTQVLLSKGCADVWSPRVLRAGMGAHFAIRIEEYADLAGFARAFRGQVIAASGTAGRSIFDVDLTTPCVLALGNEGSGLSSGLLAHADVLARIPMPGDAESLNVAAAAAVCLFERVRQLTAARNAA